MQKWWLNNPCSLNRTFSSSCVIYCMLFFMSCKNPDENVPLINHVYLNSIPDAYLHGIAGMINIAEVKVSDDKQLSQLRIKLITTSGIHQHELVAGEPAHAFVEYNQGVWDTVSIVNIGGNEITENFNLNIPDTINGGWNMEIAVLDNNGNLKTETRQVHIQNDHLPAIAVGDIVPIPQQDGLILLSVGDSILLSGFVIDPDSLEFVSAEILKGSVTTWSQNYTNINNWTFNLQQIVAPALTTTGSYIFNITAKDINGWQQTVRALVKVE